MVGGEFYYATGFAHSFGVLEYGGREEEVEEGF